MDFFSRFFIFIASGTLDAAAFNALLDELGLVGPERVRCLLLVCVYVCGCGRCAAYAIVCSAPLM